MTVEHEEEYLQAHGSLMNSEMHKKASSLPLSEVNSAPRLITDPNLNAEEDLTGDIITDASDMKSNVHYIYNPEVPNSLINQSTAEYNTEYAHVNSNNNNSNQDNNNNQPISIGTALKTSQSCESDRNTFRLPTVLIPHPERPMVPPAEPVDEDESIMNMAATLISFSSTSASSNSASPSGSSSSNPDVCVAPYEDGVDEGTVEEGKVRAYAKLQGTDWAFYLKKPSLTMGRAPSQSRQFSAGDSCPVDFYLSTADSLSRTHLRIDYNPDRTRWEMSCLGKSGVKVDRRRYEAFCPPIPLFSESIVTVANSTFSFILPMDVASREGSPFERMMRKRKSVEAEDEESMEMDEEEEYEDTASLIGQGEYSKPPQSYANLIAEAINSTSTRRMTLSCIYQYLADRYPYFRHTKNGWQNSVRHNLSLNKAFKKVPRGPDEPGKGMLWIIDPDFKHLVDGSVGRRTQIRARTPDHLHAGKPPLTFINHTATMFQQSTRTILPHHPKPQIAPSILTVASAISQAVTKENDKDMI